MPLTDITIKVSKPKEKQYKLYDGKGLYVLIKRSGKYFRLDFRINGKRKTLSLGVYPYITLAEAREKRLMPNVKQHCAQSLDSIVCDIEYCFFPSYIIITVV